MKTLRALAALALSGAIAIVCVPAALAAVTNPADNPHRIVVKGDDGNTYVDGQDTLPGFDDEECTYIPGAWFDFTNNRVHYADGQSIPWTEWDRASGYQEWLAKQANTPASVTPAKVTPSTGSTATKAHAPVTARPSASGTTAAAAPAATAPATVPASPTTVAAPRSPSLVAAADVTVPAPDAPVSDGERIAGFTILGALAAFGALLSSGHGIRRRLARGGRAS